MKHTLLLVLLSVLFSCDIGKEGGVPKPEVNIFDGKTVLWIGNSISFIHGDKSYPSRIGKGLKANAINNSKSGSTIISFGPRDGKNAQLGLSGTAYEHQHYGPYSSYFSYTENIENSLSKVDYIVIDMATMTRL